MVTFGIIRHAKTSWNLEKRVQGSMDIPLCRQGKQQAGSWGETLRDTPIDLIVASSMIRARQTAQLISRAIGNGIDIACDHALKEQDFGQWEGKTFKEIKKEFPGTIEVQESKGWDFCPPGGEPRLTVLRRASGALEDAAARFPGKRILVVTHNSVMKLLIYNSLGRTFLPGETSILKDYHLHLLSWDRKIQVERINAVNLACRT